MNARTLVRNVGLVAIAAMHLWCASDDDATPPVSSDDGGVDATPPNDAADPDRDAALASPTCSDAFCRVAVPGIEGLSLNALFAKSASEVWVVGSAGYAARFDGTTWRRVATGTRTAIRGLTESQDGTIWGGSTGENFLQLNREADGGVETIDGGFIASLNGISAIGNEVYAIGTAPRFIFPQPPQDNIWRFGPGPDGGAAEWLAISPPCPMGEFEPECLTYRAVWAESAERQWFVGDNGKIFRTDTSPAGEDDPPGRIRLVEMESSSLRRLNSLWGFSGNDVWAVGVQGVIRHFTGGDVWEVVPSPVTKDLYGVWGSRPDNVWAVGDEGAVLHWDGTAWTTRAVPFPEENQPRFHAVAGTGDDVWVAGEGVLLRSATSAGGDQ